MNISNIRTRLHTQKRQAVNITNLMKAVQRPKKEYEHITFEKIMQIVNDPNDFRERGGFCEIEGGNLKLYITGDAFMMYNKNKSAWRLGTKVKMNTEFLRRPNVVKWHTHPPGRGWWPSLEDLLQARNVRDMIFTNYGIWIFKKKGQLNQVKLNQVFEFLQHDMTMRTPTLEKAKTAQQFHTPFNCIVDTLRSLYIPKLKECGIDVYFYPGSPSMKQNVIKHLSVPNR